MSSFYKMLNKNNKQTRTLPSAKQTESVLTQVQRPGTATTSSVSATSTPKGSTSTPKGFSISKFLPSLVSTCLSRKREELSLQDTKGGYLLGKQAPRYRGRKTLVLDIDETLVHSSFDKATDSDLALSLMIKGSLYNFSVMIRPGVEELLTKACELFEVVIFTASLMEYATALMKMLHKEDLKYKILAREHCTVDGGVYVKDLSRLGRDLKDVILVDNSPNAFRYQPENAYHIKDFFDNRNDTELYSLLSCLEELAKVDDVRPVKAHKLAYEERRSSINSQQSNSTESSLKTTRAKSNLTLNTNENIYQLTTAPRPQTTKAASAEVSNALQTLRQIIDKKRQNTVQRPQKLETESLNAKVRTTDVSTAERSEDAATLEEIIIRKPLVGDCDELDLRCQFEEDLQLGNDSESANTDATGSRSSRGSSESISYNQEMNDNDAITYYAVEARAN